MKLLSRSEITIAPNRQRSKMKHEALIDLKESILAVGLLQPPIVWYSRQGPQLICGARRLAAIDLIAEEGLLFQCGAAMITPGEVPVLDLGQLDPALLFEAELSENVIREQLDWIDEARAIATLHKMRKEANPEQTVSQTAKELATKAHPEQAAAIAAAPSESAAGGTATYRRKIAQALTIDEHLGDEAISKARNAKEAFQLVLKREHATYQAELLRRRGAVAAATTLRCELRHGDALEILPQLDEGQFDLILTDPPYGIDAGSAGHRGRTVHHHNYEDTVENARALLRALLVEGWRVCKPRANIFMFNDIRNWEYFQTITKQMGWAPWPWPIIWQKSEHEGLTGGWGSQGFIRTYEMIFWATKGQRGLIRPELDIITENRVSRAARIHGAEKPASLLELLITLTTFPGDSIIDPCAGSGSTLMAAKRLKRHSLGIEKDKNIADEAFVRVNTDPDAPGEEAAAEAERLLDNAIGEAEETIDE